MTTKCLTALCLKWSNFTFILNVENKDLLTFWQTCLDFKLICLCVFLLSFVVFAHYFLIKAQYTYLHCHWPHTNTISFSTHASMMSCLVCHSWVFQRSRLSFTIASTFSMLLSLPPVVIRAGTRSTCNLVLTSSVVQVLRGAIYLVHSTFVFVLSFGSKAIAF